MENIKWNPIPNRQYPTYESEAGIIVQIVIYSRRDRNPRLYDDHLANIGRRMLAEMSEE